MNLFIVYPFLVDSPEDYSELVSFFIEKGYKILNQRKDLNPDLSIPRKLRAYNLGRDLILMSEADTVYFAKGWEYDYDCRILNRVCKKFEINIYEETSSML